MVTLDSVTLDAACGGASAQYDDDGTLVDTNVVRESTLDVAMENARANRDATVSHAFDEIEARDRVSYDRTSEGAMEKVEVYLAEQPAVSAYDPETTKERAYAEASVDWWRRGGPMFWNGPPPTVDDPSLSMTTRGLGSAARTLARAR